MERKVISPVKFVNEEEAKTLLMIVERQKEQVNAEMKKENAVIEKGEISTAIASPKKEWPKRHYPTHNEVNPFIGFCKKVFNFFKDNVSLSVNVDTGIENVTLNKVEGRGKEHNIPEVTSKINAGPVNINFDTKNLIKNIDHSGGGIRTY